MPVINVPLPTVPGNVVYVKTLLPCQFGNIHSEIYSDHFFQANTSLTSFNIFTAAVIDFLRSRSYNIGYGKYSAADLVESGVVKYEAI